jgi:hypothetical protein
LLSGLRASDLGVDGLQLEEPKEGAADGGEGDVRVGHGEAALGDAGLDVPQRARGQAHLGVELSEAAPAQDLGQFGVGLDHPDRHPHAGREGLGRVVEAADHGVDELAVLLQGVRHRRVEQRGLAVEVVVEGAEADVRAVRDLLDARLARRALRQERACGAHERGARPGAATVEAVAGGCVPAGGWLLRHEARVTDRMTRLMVSSMLRKR